MRTRRRYERHGDMGRGTAPENLYHQPRGEYEHRYNQIDGEPYVNYRHYGRRRSDEWDQNPGGGSYGYNHYSNHMDTNDHWQNGRDDRSRDDFRARNARYRDRVKGYSRRRDANDRENLFRQNGSVDEHLNRPIRGNSHDNW